MKDIHVSLLNPLKNMCMHHMPSVYYTAHSFILVSDCIFGLYA